MGCLRKGSPVLSQVAFVSRPSGLGAVFSDRGAPTHGRRRMLLGQAPSWENLRIGVERYSKRSAVVGAHAASWATREGGLQHASRTNTKEIKVFFSLDLRLFLRL